MKLPSERKTAQTPKVDLYRSNSYFDPKRIRNLYGSGSQSLKNNAGSKHHSTNTNSIDQIIQIVSRISLY